MHRRRWLEGACLIALGLAAPFASVALVRARIQAGGTPSWDAASHGLQGFVILQDISHLDFRGFFGDVFGTHFRYPFGHSVLLVPAYAIFGATWTTAVAVNAALFGALVLLLFLAAGRSAETPPLQVPGEAPGGADPIPALAGTIAALIGLTSPALIAQGMTIMLEMPALVLGTALLWLYARALDAPDRVERFGAVGWTLTALVLTATQFANVWIFVVATFEAWRMRPEDRRALLAWARGVLGSRAMFHPLHCLAVLLLGCAAAVVATGGWTLSLGGRKFSLVHPGTPLTLAVLTLGVRGAWLVWKHRERLRAAVPARYRAYFCSLVIPLSVWFFVIYPLRLIHYLNWVTQSPSSLSRKTVEFWTFYPSYLLRTGSLSPAFTAAIAALALLGFFLPRAPEKIRFLRWALLWTSLIVTLHGARQERFIVPFVPIWIVLASATAVAGLGRLRAPALRGRAAGAALLLLAIGFGAGGLSLYQSRLVGIAEGTFTPARLQFPEILQQVCSRAADKTSCRILGTFPGLSHHLFEWELRRRTELREYELDFDLTGTETKPGEELVGQKAVFEAWLGQSPEERVFALEPIDLGEELPRPTGAQGEVPPETYLTMKFMRSTPRYTRAGEWLFPAAGLRVLEYDLVGDRPAPKKRTKHRADR